MNRHANGLIGPLAGGQRKDPILGSEFKFLKGGKLIELLHAVQKRHVFLIRAELGLNVIGVNIGLVPGKYLPDGALGGGIDVNEMVVDLPKLKEQEEVKEMTIDDFINDFKI